MYTNKFEWNGRADWQLMKMWTLVITPHDFVFQPYVWKVRCERQFHQHSFSRIRMNPQCFCKR